jgi:multiple sugar transport system substrate-binding protein
MDRDIATTSRIASLGSAPLRSARAHRRSPHRVSMLATAGVLATGLLLSACSSTSSTSAPKPPSTTKAPAVASGIPTKPVTITFMEAMSSGTLRPALMHLVAQFEKAYPNITVSLEVEPSYGTLEEKEEAAIAAGDPPTMGQVYENWAARYASSHAIIPLTAYLSGKNGISSSAKADIWSDLLKAQYLPDGKVWMWPFNASDFVMYYNPNRLKADGVTVPTTWAQFAKDAKAVTKNGDWAVSMDPGDSAGPANGGEWLLALINAYGGHWVKNGKPDFDSHAAIKAATFLANLEKEGALKVGTDYPGQTALGSEHTAFDMSTIASYYYNSKAIAGKFPLGVAAFPSGPAGQGNALEGTNNVIFAGASPTQRAAAWAFMKWLSEPAQTAYWASHTGYLPVTKAALPLMKSYDASHPYQEIAAKSLTYAEATPPYSWWDEASGDLVVALESILVSHVSPASALKTAQSKALAAMRAG